MHLRWVALLGSLALSACAPAYVSVVRDPPAIDVRAAVPRELARICLVRSSVVGGVLVYVVRDNGVLVAVLGAGAYACYHAEPGVHVIASDAADYHTGIPHHRVERSITVAAGARRYLGYDTDLIGGGFEVDELVEREALEDIDGANYQALISSPTHERVLQPTEVAPAATVQR